MIHINQLLQYDEVYIETTANDRFLIIKSEDGYIFKDIVPPVLEKHITDFKSIKMPKYMEQAAMSGKGDVDPSKIMFFDGIAKGFSFVFYTGENEMNLTKGKINTLYIKKDLLNFRFRVHLMEQPGKKFELSKADKDFVVETDTGSYHFEFDDSNTLVFEGREVTSIFSLFKFKGSSHAIDFSVINEFDVSPYYIHINKPMIIITKDPESESQLKFSFVYENVNRVSFNL